MDEEAGPIRRRGIRNQSPKEEGVAGVNLFGARIIRGISDGKRCSIESECLFSGPLCRVAKIMTLISSRIICIAVSEWLSAATLFIASGERKSRLPPNPQDLASLYLERTLKIGGPSKAKSAPLVRHLVESSIQLVMRCNHVISPISAD
jgi:hypothetical protein